MMNKRNQKGFTLAELLIVVAIIAVLVAIAIPVFTTQLRRAELATDLANTRAAYAEVVSEKMAKNDYNSNNKLSVSISAGLKHTSATVTGNKIVLTHRKANSVTGSFAFDSDVEIAAIN